MAEPATNSLEFSELPQMMGLRQAAGCVLKSRAQPRIATRRQPTATADCARNCLFCEGIRRLAAVFRNRDVCSVVQH